MSNIEIEFGVEAACGLDSSHRMFFCLDFNSIFISQVILSRVAGLLEVANGSEKPNWNREPCQGLGPNMSPPSSLDWDC